MLIASVLVIPSFSKMFSTSSFKLGSVLALIIAVFDMIPPFKQNCISIEEHCQASSLFFLQDSNQSAIWFFQDLGADGPFFLVGILIGMFCNFLILFTS